MKEQQYIEVPQHAPPPAEPAYATSPGEPWMSIPVGRDCPQGLEYLTVLDELLVSQKIQEVGQVRNPFKVKNSLGQNLYYAYEESNMLSRTMMQQLRPFEMKVLDNFQNEVLHVNRPMRCDLFCCFPNCSSILEVSAPPGQIIGTVEKVCFFMKPKFLIKNSFGDVMMNIEGSVSGPWKCCKDIDMKVFSVNNEEIGKITKNWSGPAKEMFSDADYFSVTFPLNLDVRMKALLFAAVFLVNILLYEN
ncbi:phospholipid scramblase 2 [Drosophila grimshawi]|nr:phospholipid scramblase 2 [Drosophila grimshawi]